MTNLEKNTTKLNDKEEIIELIARCLENVNKSYSKTF